MPAKKKAANKTNKPAKAKAKPKPSPKPKAKAPMEASPKPKSQVVKKPVVIAAAPQPKPAPISPPSPPIDPKDLIDCEHCQATGKCAAGQPYDKSRHQRIFNKQILTSCFDCLLAADESHNSKKLIDCRFCHGTGKVPKPMAM